MRRTRILAASLRLPGSSDRLPGLLLEAARSSPPAPLLRLGRERALLLSEPDDVSHVLVGASGAYEKPSRMIGSGMRRAAGSGVLTSTGPEASERRALVAPALRGDAVAPYGTLARRLAARRVGDWVERGELDLFEDLYRLAREIAIATTVGEEWRGASPGLESALEERRRLMGGALSARLDPRAGRPATGTLEIELSRAVAAARPEPERPASIMARLLAASGDERRIREELRTLLLSGYETVATAAAWMLLELAAHPERLEAVRAEGRDGVSEFDAPAPATRAAVEETLRLHPPIFRFHRRSTRVDRLPSGVPVPAGRLVLISPFVLGRLPALWENPERFDPSRFDPALAAHHKYAHIPFGSGPRVCIARALALLQVRAVVAAVVAALDLAPLALAAPDPISSRRRPPCRVPANPAR